MGLPNPDFWAVSCALILYNGSVVAELVRAGVINLPKGQHEAAEAIGLTRAQALRYVLVPQALMAMLPALNSPTVAHLHDPAWVSLEIVVDIRIVRDLIPRLVSAGAEGIIEYPLNKVV
jgi:glutamate transport system permease protein